jgi:protein-disulfide isomerase
MKTTFATALTASLRLAILSLATVVLLQAPVQAQDGVLKRGDVETIVREYLLENPEVIREAIEELERREVAKAEEARVQALSSVSDILFNSTRQVELGNPDGDVTLVEFFDYNCGYCKRAMADMMQLLQEDDKLRVVLKEFPVLGEGSVQAAQVAVAVNAIAPEKYLDFHRELMAARGQANLASAMEAAVNTGLESDAVETAMNDPEVRATIEEVYTLARRLGLNGTPAYVVGDEVLMGAVGYDRLKQGIEAARNCGEATC